VIGENSLNSSSGGTYTCAMGTPVNGNCTMNLPPAKVSTSVAIGANTVLLTNPVGYTICPPSVWPGPGMPLAVASNGNIMQLVLDTVGSGVQETVTVTGLSAVTTDTSHYACSITFNAANAHASGAQVVATRAWQAQSATDILEAVVQAAKTWVTQFPSLQVIDTQQLLYGKFAASAGVPVWQTDNLHISLGQTYQAEDSAVVQLITSYTSTPAKQFPPPVANTLYAGGQYQDNVVNSIPSVDPSFSWSGAALTRIFGAYWNPWTGSASGASYPLGCADPAYFDTVLFGLTGYQNYVPGATQLILSTASDYVSNLRGGGNTQSDIILIPGVGCYEARISSVAMNQSGALAVITLASPYLPIALNGAGQVLIQRYKTFDSSGLAYLRQPEAYPFHRQGFMSGGGVGSYSVNYLQQSGLPSMAPLSSISGGSIVSWATSPLTQLTLDSAHLGNGLAVNGDVVTIACKTTNASGTLSVQNGYPYAVTIASIGAGCGPYQFNTSVGVTDTTTPAVTGLQMFITTGWLRLTTPDTKVLTTKIGTGTPAGYANGDTVSLVCSPTNATFTAQGVVSGVPSYLKAVGVGSGCVAGSNLATTTGGSGTGLTITATVAGATTCSHTATNANVSCIDSTGTPYNLYNNLAMDVYANAFPDTYSSNDTAKQLNLLNPTVANLSTHVTGCSGGAVDCNTVLTNGTMAAVLTGTSASIGGSALSSGQCTSGTVTVTGATISMVSRSTPTTYPGDGYLWESYISATNTVTLKICALIDGTPTASTYNVRVLQ
jgi:hypothetical protein